MRSFPPSPLQVVLAATFLLASFIPGLRAERPDSLIGATDLVKIRQLGNVALSPDGRQIVYTVRTIEPKADKPDDYTYRTQLWTAAIDGKSGARPLTTSDAGASSPAWSPDGQQLAFIRADAEKKPQLWLLPLAGGEARQLTKIPQGVANPRWSPDGTRLAFQVGLSYADVRAALESAKTDAAPAWASERVERKANDTFNWGAKTNPSEPKPAGAKAPEPKNASAKSSSPEAAADGTLAERREWLAKHEADGNPRVTTRLDFLGESDLETTPAFNHIHVVEIRPGAEPVDLTPGYASFENAVWTADSQRLIFEGPDRPGEHPDRDINTALYTVNRDGQDRRDFLRHDGYSLSGPAVSPDGKTVAFVAEPARTFTERSYGQSSVGTVAIGGGKPTLLTEKLDRGAGAVKWSADGKHLYFVAASNGGAPLFRVPAAGGTVEKLTANDAGVRDYDVSTGDLAFVLTKAANPYELYRSTLNGKEVRLLTAHNSEWLRDKTVTTPERRELTRPDGLKVEYWVIRPAYFEAGKKYPLLVQIHGGPSAMWGPGEPSMWHEFQYFAARGYVVAYCNPRGSSGYGYKFQYANYQNWGPGPAGDVLAMADAVAQEPWVDPARQVITGGSYGGYLTTWIISQDQRFKAAVAVRGVYDLTTFFGEGNAWRLVPGHFGGYPWQKDVRALLDAQSPVTFVEAIKTPLLIKHGDVDLRTGIVQSEMLYRSLKVLGRPVEYVRYPRATHELSRSGEPLQRLDRLVRFDEFFQRYLAAPTAPVPPPAPAPKSVTTATPPAASSIPAR